MASDDFAAPYGEELMRKLADIPDNAKLSLELGATIKVVPLVFYTGEGRKVVGEATVLDGMVHARFDPKAVNGTAIGAALHDGMLHGVSINFEFFEYRKETEQYNFEPTRPIEYIPDIEKPLPHTFRTLAGLIEEKLERNEFLPPDGPFTKEVMDELWNRDKPA